MMHVAREHDGRVARRVDAERFERALAGGTRLAPRARRVGQEHEPARALGRIEERALPRVDVPELPVDAEELEAARQREPEVARLLDGHVAGDRHGAGLLHLLAAGEGVGPREHRVLVRLRVQRVGELGSLFEGARRLAEAREAVEPVVPVVVAGDREKDARTAPVGHGLEDAVERRDEAPAHLAHGGHGIGQIAAVYEHVAARQLFAVERVVGGEQARERLAHAAVVARVGDEVDPHLAAHRRRERRGVARAAGAQHGRDATEELGRGLGHHPLARVDAVGRDRTGQEVPEVTPERAEPEPCDRPRPDLAARAWEARAVRRARSERNRRHDGPY